MALLGKTSCKAAVFLAALVVMATVFLSSHAAQGQGDVGEEKMACKRLQARMQHRNVHGLLPNAQLPRRHLQTQ
uniref:Uncharacterized protein n=1 Tax=Oryza meridionalis TaxID=40149 RepID=A0A0E0D7M8_9ORYZ